MRDLLNLFRWLLLGLVRSRRSLGAENLAPRHQLNVLRRASPRRPVFSNFDRMIFVCLYRIAPRILDAITIVEPERVIRWHRTGELSLLPALVRHQGRTAGSWQNGYAERLIGSIRRECLDHVIVFGERHLRHVLRSYQQYYNGTRTHLALAKDSPLTRSVQAIGSILPLPILGGLHHRYVRV